MTRLWHSVGFHDAAMVSTTRRRHGVGFDSTTMARRQRQPVAADDGGLKSGPHGLRFGLIFYFILTK
jgi:hypothetical protein